MSFLPLEFRKPSTITNTTSIKIHNNLSGLNDGNYIHLTYEEYKRVKNYASNITDGIISKEDYQNIFNKLSFTMNNNPLTGLIYGDNEGYIITNENNDGFLIKAPSNNRIFRITSDISSPYDLTTKQYVDEKIQMMYQNLLLVCQNNNMLQNELSNNYKDLNIIQSSNNDMTTKLYVDTQISSMMSLLTKIIEINTNLQLQIAQFNLDKLNNIV